MYSRVIGILSGSKLTVTTVVIDTSECVPYVVRFRCIMNFFKLLRDTVNRIVLCSSIG